MFEKQPLYHLQITLYHYETTFSQHFMVGIAVVWKKNCDLCIERMLGVLTVLISKPKKER